MSDEVLFPRRHERELPQYLDLVQVHRLDQVLQLEQEVQEEPPWSPVFLKVRLLSSSPRSTGGFCLCLEE